MDKICASCKNTFTTYQKRQIFCSISCAQKSRHSKNVVICKNCKVEFSTCQGNNARRFCCKACFHAFNTKEKVPFTCKNCGKISYFRETITKHRTTCCKECKYELLGKENAIRLRQKNICGKKHPSYKKGTVYYRKLAFLNFPKECVCCKSELYKLHVHHINGDRNINELGNLALLCHCCHKRLHTRCKKYNLSVEQSLELGKLTGHLPREKSYLRIPGVLAEVEAAVSAVLAKPA